MTLSRLGRAALAYANLLGWAVFPLAPRQKLPLIPRAQGGRGCLDATRDPDRIAAWWLDCPRANVGLATGAPSGLFVVDIDPRNEGDAAWAELVAGRELPETPQSITGSGGAHILFAGETGCGKLVLGVDLKGTGGYIVAPPSIHPNGELYIWEALARPDEVPLAPAPQWLLGELGEQLPRREHYSHEATVDPQSFALGAAFAKAGWLGPQIRPGVFAVVCPNRADHTAGRDFDTSTVLFAPRPGLVRGTFYCSHSHCQHLR